MTTKPSPKHAELPAAKLRWTCELSRIPFETTAQAELREGFIGQERALRALKMGAELSAPGYNVFVCGLAGTSRGGTIARRKSIPACMSFLKPLAWPRGSASRRGRSGSLKLLT